MIIRRRHTANFTTIGNALFEDERLAADEVGILAYLLSRPHDWEVRRPAMMRRWRIGRDALKRIVDNWMRTGWCCAQKIRLANGTFDIVYEIRDEPGPSLSEDEVREALSLVSSEAKTDEIGKKSAVSDLPGTDQPGGGEPGVVKPLLADPYVADKILLNTDSPRTDSDQKVDDGVVARAREPLISPQAFQLASDVMRILGVDREFTPPNWCGAPMWFQAGLNCGWRPDVVLIAAEKVRAAGRQINTHRYLEKPILQEHALLAKLPTASVLSSKQEVTNVPQNASAGSWQESRDAFRRAHARLRAYNDDQSRRGETGRETFQPRVTDGRGRS